MWEEVAIDDISVLGQRLGRGYFKGRVRQKNFFFRDFIEDSAPGSRRRGRKRQKLSNDDKIQIAHKALVGKELRKDVAKEMRVTP